MNQVIYSKLSNDRKDRFNIRTDIFRKEDGQLEVHKVADHALADEHIASFAWKYETLADIFKDSFIEPNVCVCKKDRAIFEYIEGESLENLINMHINNDDMDGAIELLNKYIQELRSCYQDQAQTGLNIDAILPNIFVKDNVWTMIDYEWTFSFPIPIDFLVYRIIFYYKQNNAKQYQKLNRDLFQLYEMTDEVQKLYEQMETKFQEFTKYNGISEQDIIRSMRDANTAVFRNSEGSQDIAEFISHMNDENLLERIHNLRMDAFTQKNFMLYTTAQEDTFRLYPAQGEIQEKCRGDILFVTHELSRTGAPVVLQDMAIVLQENGYRITFITPRDGALREELTARGIPVVVDGSIMNFVTKELGICQRLMNQANLTIINTVDTCKAVMCNLNNNNRIIWWLHEALAGFEGKKNILPQELSDNIQVEFVAEFVRHNMEQCDFHYQGDILHYGTDEIKRVKSRNDDDIVRFACVGAYQSRKGQDLLADAIASLSLESLQHSEFYFAGPILEFRIADSIRKMAKAYPNVYYYEEMPRDEIQLLYQNMDCLVVPSRDDPLPVVATENMSLANVCICSSNTGTAGLIEDGVDGFVFENENLDELVDKLEYVITHKDEIVKIGENGKKIFEKYLKMDAFEKKILSIVEMCLENSNG